MVRGARRHLRPPLRRGLSRVAWPALGRRERGAHSMAGVPALMLRVGSIVCPLTLCVGEVYNTRVTDRRWPRWSELAPLLRPSLAMNRTEGRLARAASI